MSNDIEKNPGPHKIDPYKLIAILIFTTMTLLIISISHYNAETANHLPRQNIVLKEKCQLNLAIQQIIHRNQKRYKPSIKISSRAAYLLILLLTAGDIQPNPGPDNTSKCTVEDFGPDLEEDLNIGRIPQPPHYTHYSIYSTPKAAERQELEHVPGLCLEKPMQKKHVETPEDNEEIKKKKSRVKKSPNLLKHLPKISAVNYQGKEICKNCNKHISKTQKSVLLAGGERKIHFKCRNRETSDIPIHTPETSNIVKYDPSPKVNETCLNCKLAARKMQSVICSTCKGWCHLNCSSPMEAITLKQSFEWLCPNPTCAPNHYAADEDQILPVTNRFSTLKRCKNNQANHISKNKKVKEKKAQKNLIKKPKPQSDQRQAKNLLNHLTKITPKDYQGSEICNECNKKINGKCKLMECIECERCTHLKCIKTKANRGNKIRDLWFCRGCLKNEELPNNIQFSDEELNNHNDTKIKTMKEMEDMNTKHKKSKLWMHFNCRSLHHAYDEIEAICSNVKPDVLLLTETWLDESNPKNAYVPRGYIIKRKDRTEEFKHKYGKKSGGGVAILHKEHISVTIVPSLTTEEDEILWIKLKEKQSTCLYACAYRTSYCDMLNGEISKLEKNIVKASSLSKNIVMFGDFNCDLNNNSPDNPTKKLITCMKEMNLYQKLKGATRIETGEPKLLDHIWVEEQMDENILASGICTGVSDHAGIYAYVRAGTEEEEMITTRNYKNYDKDNMCKEFETNLQNSHFQEFINNKNVNKATACWTKCFQEALNKNAPKRTFAKKNKQKHPWFTEELKEMTRKKNKWLQLWYLYRKSEDRKVYRKIKNQINHLKKRLKSNYFSEQIEDLQNKPRKLWNLYKELTGNTKVRENIEPDIVNKKTANDFNHYFATVGSKIQQKLHISSNTPDLPENGFEFQKETESTIYKLIARIRIDVATGNDEINAKVLKDTIDTITPSLTELVNLSYETNTFPDSIKEAMVRPIFKKEDKEKPEFYRPVSILPIISKIFERSATDQFLKYLEENNKLSNTQHAYRRRHSTITCLADLLDEIRRRRDANETVGVIGMDLSKAFDSINHDILLQKLKDIGAGPNLMTWMNSYLTRRKQCVKFKNVISDMETVTSGVPQGSILGPVLFIIFTNSLAEDLKCYKLTSYADDSQILISAKSPREMKLQIEEVMKKAQDWYTKHSLLNNLSKTEIMIITSKKNKQMYEKIDYTITENHEKTKIRGRGNMKILGVWIEEDLTWSKQISNMKAKAFNNARNLCRVNQILPMNTKIQLYNSYVASQLSYGDIIWGGCSEVNKKKLQQVQNFSLRNMTGKQSEEARKSLNFLTLEEKRNVHYSTYGYKLSNGLAPSNQTMIFNEHKSTSKRLAEKGIMKPPAHKTQQFETSTLYKTIENWNKIPSEIKQCKTVNTFKTNLQSWKCKAK